MADPGPWPRQTWTAGLLIFSLALALRLLFWHATPDATWPYTACYKGDAATWLAWADDIQQSRTFETGLPIRPPGTAYLVASTWNGRPAGIVTLKLLWCLLGALAVVLVYAAARRSFGQATALAVGLWCAGSTGLLILSTSLNNETPYLVLVAATLFLWETVRQRPGAAPLAAWSALHAAACLFRAEHVLFFVLVSVCLAAAWAFGGSPPDGWKPALGRLGWSLVVFALVLLPWHLSASSAIRRFNTEPLREDPVTEDTHRRVERLLREIRWEPEALAELEKLPAATRRTARNFVAATVGVRGRFRVTARDVGILEQAFGSRPEPIGTHPFVALYGGLNFYLANNPQATGGFNRAPLERSPPLAGGPERYPLALIRGLPPVQLSLTYPPHLDALNRGYRLGLEWILQHPLDYFSLAVEKLRIFWSGAALGIGGHNLPLGLSGLRREVDLVVPEGGIVATSWRAALLILAVIGIYVGRRREALLPWLAFLLSKVLVTVAFFGYARQGATAVPIVALLVCLAVGRLLAHDGRWWNRPRWAGHRWWAVPLTVTVLLLAIESARWTAGPVLILDGRKVDAADPFLAAEHRDRRLEVR